MSKLAIICTLVTLGFSMAQWQSGPPQQQQGQFQPGPGPDQYQQFPGQQSQYQQGAPPYQPNSGQSSQYQAVPPLQAQYQQNPAPGQYQQGPLPGQYQQGPPPGQYQPIYTPNQYQQNSPPGQQGQYQSNSAPGQFPPAPGQLPENYKPHEGYCPREEISISQCSQMDRSCYDDNDCHTPEKCCFTSLILNGLRQCYQGCFKSLTIPDNFQNSNSNQ